MIANQLRGCFTPARLPIRRHLGKSAVIENPDAPMADRNLKDTLKLVLAKFPVPGLPGANEVEEAVLNWDWVKALRFTVSILGVC